MNNNNQSPRNFTHAFFMLVWPLDTWKKKAVFWIVILVIGFFIVLISLFSDEIKTAITSRVIKKITNRTEPPQPAPVKDDLPTSPIKPEIEKTIPQQRKSNDTSAKKPAIRKKIEEDTGVKIYPDETFNK